jgi:hypothetical protein
MKKLPSNEFIYDDSSTGENVREQVGKAMTEGLKREWFSLNMHLGNRYINSPINIYDEPEDSLKVQSEFEDAINYIPSTRPGARAPHIWLDKDLSTLDLINKKYTLFCFTNITDEIKVICQYANELKIPLSIFYLDSIQTKSIYEWSFVMIRPDGHVAWRGHNYKLDPHLFWSTLTGNSNTIHH